MEVRFGDPDLDRLDFDPRYDARLPPAIVRMYRKRIQQIRAARDERDFYQLKSLHFERLKGGDRQIHSMRLNDQYRLLVRLCGEAPNKVVWIVAVKDYH
jgi:toxin HigB-1